eukprot:scaffold3068_cov401-Prasinococcus_capsulatus_cf.AAC.8
MLNLQQVCACNTRQELARGNARTPIHHPIARVADAGSHRASPGRSPPAEARKSVARGPRAARQERWIRAASAVSSSPPAPGRRARSCRRR